MTGRSARMSSCGPLRRVLSGRTQSLVVADVAANQVDAVDAIPDQLAPNLVMAPALVLQTACTAYMALAVHSSVWPHTFKAELPHISLPTWQ